MKLVEIRCGEVNITEATGYAAETLLDRQFKLLTTEPVSGAYSAIFVFDDGGGIRQYWMRGYNIKRKSGE